MEMHDPRGALFPIFQISFDPASSILSTKFTLHLFRTIIQDDYANAYPFERRFNAAEHIEFHFQQAGEGILALVTSKSR